MMMIMMTTMMMMMMMMMMMAFGSLRLSLRHHSYGGLVDCFFVGTHAWNLKNTVCTRHWLTLGGHWPQTHMHMTQHFAY